jgi:hypothetical protein
VVVSWVPAPLGRKGKTGRTITFAELLVIHANAAVARDIIGLPDARLLLAVEKAIRRFRLKLPPRPMDLPPTSRAGATRRQSARPEPEARRVSTRLGRGASGAVRLTQRIRGGLAGVLGL